jgi:hypothetical protein
MNKVYLIDNDGFVKTKYETIDRRLFEDIQRNNLGIVVRPLMRLEVNDYFKDKHIICYLSLLCADEQELRVLTFAETIE